MTSLLILSAQDVAFITKSLSASKLCTMIGRTMHAISADLKVEKVQGKVAPIQNPLRIALDSEKYKTLVMPSRLTTSQNVSMNACKMVAVPKPGNPVAGLPGTTLLFDEISGAVKAVVNSGELTGLRTAAASTLATKLLAQPNPSYLLVFGTGTQAYYHARLILESFPSLKSVTFVARTISDRVHSLQQKMRIEFPEIPIDMVTSEDAPAMVKKADIICTCVPSTEPVFQEADLKEGVHINAIGSYTPSMTEFPPSILTSSSPLYIPRILVDSKSACLKEAGELIKASVSPDALEELGDVVDAQGEGRHDLDKFGLRKSGRSLFKCVGIGGMDVAVTMLVYEMAVKMKIGTLVPY